MSSRRVRSYKCYTSNAHTPPTSALSTFRSSTPDLLTPSSSRRVEIANLLIHQPLQLFPSRRVLFSNIPVHVEFEKVTGEGLGSGLVFWVVVCVEVRMVEALFDCVSLLRVDWGILVPSQNFEWAQRTGNRKALRVRREKGRAHM